MNDMNIEVCKVIEAFNDAIQQGQIAPNDVIKSISSPWCVITPNGKYHEITIHIADKTGKTKAHIDVQESN